MSRTFQIEKSYYGDDFSPIYKKDSIEFNPGLTVLVGCNGSGKTTLLKQIKRSLEPTKIPVLLHDNYHNGIKQIKETAAFRGDYSLVARDFMDSEGEGIVTAMGVIASKMGGLVHSHPEAKEYWFLFDAVDSGLSIDNVVDLKSGLFQFVIDQNKDKDIYIIVSTNAYEFANGERCLDVVNGEYIDFKSYNGYKRFILKSKRIKDKRYERDNKMAKKREKSGR